MKSKKLVIDVGQCNPDHAALTRAVEQCGASILRAHTGADAKRLLAEHEVALVLVNRILDADGSDGMQLIGELIAMGRAPVMLVSNYPDCQSKAVEMGALPGFGKAALADPSTIAMLQAVL